ncbi:hypothetical protein B0H34DRAFT_720180 [Crassisporium funariophilum]|nr:hypothetical protein B0H34DRAFT_720180 [Crassisporium funariophilum]
MAATQPVQSPHYIATSPADNNLLPDDSDPEIDDSFPIGEDDDDISLDGLSDTNDDDIHEFPPPYYPGITLCIICRRKPPYSKGGKSYPTCGNSCAAILNNAAGQNASSSSSPSHRGSPRGRGGSPSNRGGSYFGRGASRAVPGDLPVQNPSQITASPAIGFLSQHLSGDRYSRLQARGRNSSQEAQPQPGSSRAHITVAGIRALVPGRQTHSCVICLVKPCRDSKYVTCGITCAEKLCKNGSNNPNMCDYCHRRPKAAGFNQCGVNCRDSAKLACLMCKSRPKYGQYHLCGQTCKQIAMKSTPLILEAPPGHATYELVEKKFKTAWKVTTTPCPPIKKIFKIIESKSFLQPYDKYKKTVGRSTEVFRYHGTARRCTLGTSGNNQLCTATACALCSILRTSFKVSLASPSGAFGAGVYTSSASNKSYSYTRSGTGAIILTKVVLGKVRSVSGWNEVMSLPAGFNSVVFDRQNGQLNETIVYSDDAIRPVFLITF